MGLRESPCILLTLKVLENPSLDVPYPKSALCRHPQTVLRVSLRLRTCNLVRNRAPGTWALRVTCMGFLPQFYGLLRCFQARRGNP